MVTGRFAPSPSGLMHLGNASVALLSWLSARKAGGEVVLRVEDLDPARSRREYTEAILDDLIWLRLPWDRRAEDQSRRSRAYGEALEQLARQDLIYPCYCSRDELRASSAPHAADGRVIYPGTCRGLTAAQRAAKAGSHCLRAKVPDRAVSFIDGLQGPQTMSLQREWGDFIVRRADGVAAYQLAVVVDDADNGVTQVVRGRDLLTSTPVQLWLYEMLGLRAPVFYHTPMLLSEDGRRLSKRDGDLSLRGLRERWAPEKVIGLLAWLCGVIDRWEGVAPGDLIRDFDWKRVRREDVRLTCELLEALRSG